MTPPAGAVGGSITAVQKSRRTAFEAANATAAPAWLRYTRTDRGTPYRTCALLQPSSAAPARMEPTAAASHTLSRQDLPGAGARIGCAGLLEGRQPVSYLLLELEDVYSRGLACLYLFYFYLYSRGLACHAASQARISQTCQSRKGNGPGSTYICLKHPSSCGLRMIFLLFSTR